MLQTVGSGYSTHVDYVVDAVFTCVQGCRTVSYQHVHCAVHVIARILDCELSPCALCCIYDCKDIRLRAVYKQTYVLCCTHNSSTGACLTTMLMRQQGL